MSASTCWLRTTSGLKRVEERVHWNRPNVRAARILDWSDPGVFVFEQYFSKVPVVSALALASYTARGGGGWEALFDGVDRASRPKSQFAQPTRYTSGIWIHEFHQANPACAFRMSHTQCGSSTLGVSLGHHSVNLRTVSDPEDNHCALRHTRIKTDGESSKRVATEQLGRSRRTS